MFFQHRPLYLFLRHRYVFFCLWHRCILFLRYLLLELLTGLNDDLAARFTNGATQSIEDKLTGKGEEGGGRGGGAPALRKRRRWRRSRRRKGGSRRRRSSGPGGAQGGGGALGRPVLREVAAGNPRMLEQNDNGNPPSPPSTIK